MKKISFLITLFSFLTLQSPAMTWQPRQEIKSHQICGVLEKQKTMGGTAEVVFDELSLHPVDGRTVRQSYIVVPTNDVLAKQLPYLKENQKHNVCIRGVYSSLKMIDSAPPFYTFEILY